MKHLIGTASAAGVALGLALFASTAYAQQVSSTGDGKSGDAYTTTKSSNNSNSQNTTYTVPITDSLNDNSRNSNVSDNGNDQSTHVSKDNGNLLYADNGNDQSKYSDSNNDNSKHVMRDSNNDNSRHITRDSNNDNSSHLSVGDVSLAMSETDLSGSVSGQTFNARGSNGGLSSGALSFSGNAMQGYAGITNANYVTGQGSLGQAANSVTATSSISFR